MNPTGPPVGTAGTPPGSQTLARGLQALHLVAAAPDGLTVAQVATALGVHRTIASRLLATLAEFHLVHRMGDGPYRAGAGLAALAHGVHAGLRAAAAPAMQQLADTLGSTVSLLVREGDEAVALAVVEPTTGRYHISFREGGRHPLQRGAAGLALLSAGPAQPDEPPGAGAARQHGYAITFGEVEPEAWGAAAPIPGTAACLNVITYRRDVMDVAPTPLLAAARTIGDLLQH